MIHLSFNGQRYGTAQVNIFATWDEASTGWIFPNIEGGLNHYRAQLPVATKAPVMIFDDLTVDCEFRRMGLGSAGMMVTMRHFRNKGARVAFLRIGTQGEDWYAGKVWRQQLYEKLGWVELENHPSYNGDVPIMWHSLEGDLFSSRVDEVSLHIVDDRSFGFSWPYIDKYFQH